MKKTLLVTALLLAISSSAFAATQGTDLTTGTVSGEGAAIYGGSDGTVAGNATSPIVKLSTGVAGVAVYNTFAYSIATKHTKGSKVFGTANDSTSIYWKPSPQALLGATTGDAPASSGNGAFSGWTTY
jgi:hypothetical protein